MVTLLSSEISVSRPFRMKTRHSNRSRLIKCTTWLAVSTLLTILLSFNTRKKCKQIVKSLQKNYNQKYLTLDKLMLPSCKLLTGNNIDVHGCHVASKEPVRAYAVGEKTSAIKESQIFQFLFLVYFRSTLGEHPVKRLLLTTKLHGSTTDCFLSNA